MPNSLPSITTPPPQENGDEGNIEKSIAAKQPSPIIWNSKNPFPAKLIAVRDLNGKSSSKQTVHVEFSLEDSGLTYEAGDAMAVWPTNCPDEVQEIISLIKADPDISVVVKNQPCRLFDAMFERLDIHQITTKLLRSFTQIPNELELHRFIEGKTIKSFTEWHLVDLLEKFPMAIDPQLLVDVLRPMRPRLYSIASSINAHRNQVHLTVAAVRYHQNGRPRKGVTSVFLAERLAIGGTAKSFIHRASHFRVPTNNDAPMIMVGPGTGIAPFRAFLQERQARQATGPNWLFFGDQHRQGDFLYEQELLAMQQAGLLTKLDTAFSRDQTEKIYVQHRMREKGAELWRWLQEGAHFYICGDASRMANDVTLALHEIIMEHGQLNDPQAKQYIADMTSNHRFQRDVY